VGCCGGGPPPPPPPPQPGRITVHGTPNTAAFVAGIRPKWYPTIERPKATVFTPKELEEWNQGKVGPHAESKR
jgi:hypothetical protein